MARNKITLEDLRRAIDIMTEQGYSRMGIPPQLLKINTEDYNYCKEYFDAQINSLYGIPILQSKLKPMTLKRWLKNDISNTIRCQTI